MLRQLRAKYVGIFQNQIKGKGNQRNSHSADKPSMINALKRCNCKLNERCNYYCGFFLLLNAFPICNKKPRPEEKIKSNADIAENRMNSVGIIARRGNGIMNGKKNIAKLGNNQINCRRFDKLARLTCFLLNQYCNVLIKKKKYKYHCADEQAVADIV